jgi:hypothetical protein
LVAEVSGFFDEIKKETEKKLILGKSLRIKNWETNFFKSQAAGDEFPATYSWIPISGGQGKFSKRWDFSEKWSKIK